jgi:hypothetical protein
MGSCIEHCRVVVAYNNIVVVCYIVGKKSSNVSRADMVACHKGMMQGTAHVFEKMRMSSGKRSIVDPSACGCTPHSDSWLLTQTHG